jgi:hypothetical protein
MHPSSFSARPHLPLESDVPDKMPEEDDDKAPETCLLLARLLECRNAMVAAALQNIFSSQSAPFSSKVGPMPCVPHTGCPCSCMHAVVCVQTARTLLGWPAE